MAAVDRNIIRFILRALLMAVSVVLPFAVWYVCSDPFKVLYRYDEYYGKPELDSMWVGINKGMVTVNNYLDRVNSDSVSQPNAFIFGSSLSCYYNVDEWRKLLADSDSSRAGIYPFHFDSSAESPMSMARKLRYLDSNSAPIDYALIVLDPVVLGMDDGKSPFAIDPVEIRPGVKHFLKYHYTFFRGATNADFLKSWAYSCITGHPDNIGHNIIYTAQPIENDRFTNQERMPLWDSVISVNPAEFYARYPLIPPPSGVTIGSPVITGKKADSFRTVAEILKEKHSDYQVIISPNRRGIALSPADRALLSDIFGAERVHDFSSSHVHYLEADTMLYDDIHYRAPLATMLLHETYE